MAITGVSSQDRKRHWSLLLYHKSSDIDHETRNERLRHSGAPLLFEYRSALPVFEDPMQSGAQVRPIIWCARFCSLSTVGRRRSALHQRDCQTSGNSAGDHGSIAVNLYYLRLSTILGHVNSNTSCYRLKFRDTRILIARIKDASSGISCDSLSIIQRLDCSPQNALTRHHWAAARLKSLISNYTLVAFP